MDQLQEYRARMLDRFERLPGEYAQTLAALPAPEWWLRRTAEGRTLHALMAHVRDLETLAYLPRLRRILTEADPVLPAFGAHRWSEVNYDPTEPMESLLAQFAHAREEELDLLRNMPPDGWVRRAFHPPAGWRTTQWWVERALVHALQHLDEIRAAR